MLGVVALLIVATFSAVVTKVAAAALEATGVTRELAKFQARSAFTGVGFTTDESEAIVANPARRRIVEWLMLAGNVGTVTVIASLILGFRAGTFGDILSRFGVLFVGLAALFGATRTNWFDTAVKALFARMVERFAALDVRDYEGMLNVRENYGIRELRVSEDGWLANNTLAECDLMHEGVLVLAVRRADGEYIGAPPSDTDLRAGDLLVAYGEDGALGKLEERRRGEEGDQEHGKAVAKQRSRASDRESEAD